MEERKFEVGEIVLYRVKNQIGLIGEILTERHPGAPVKLRCWWHMGGGRSLIDSKEVDKIKFGKILTTTFENEYAKGSLFERQLRLYEGDGPTDDLIDEKDFSPFIKELLSADNGTL